MCQIKSSPKEIANSNENKITFYFYRIFLFIFSFEFAMHSITFYSSFANLLGKLSFSNKLCSLKELYYFVTRSKIL
jgi:hypothetical protein